MRSNREPAVLLACLLIAGSPTACSSMEVKPTPVVSSDGVEIQKILTEVQQALEVTAIRLKDFSMPPLESVTLTLQASLVHDVGAKINLLIISFGHSIQRESTQELTLTLTPPKGDQKGLVAPRAPLSDQLVYAIVGAVQGVQKARDGKPPLELQSLETSLSFVVEKDTSPGGTFTIQPVTVSLGADFKDKAVQRLRLVFKAKK